MRIGCDGITRWTMFLVWIFGVLCGWATLPLLIVLIAARISPEGSDRR